MRLITLRKRYPRAYTDFTHCILKVSPITHEYRIEDQQKMEVEKKHNYQKSRKKINKVISSRKTEAENGVLSCPISRHMERASEKTGVSVRTS